MGDVADFHGVRFRPPFKNEFQDEAPSKGQIVDGVSVPIRQASQARVRPAPAVSKVKINAAPQRG